MKREARERRIAMIGRGNLDIWLWTGTRTGVMIFFSVIGVLMIIAGAMLPAVRVPFWFFGTIITLLAVVGGIGDYVVDELPNRVIIGTIRLGVAQFIPLTHPKVRVVGNDGVKYLLSPSMICRSDADTKSSVVISGRLERPLIQLMLGKDYKRIISLS